MGAAVLWGTGGAVSTLAPAGAAPVAVGAVGLALGGLLLLATAPRPLALPRTARDRGLVAVGAAAVAGYPLAYYPAVAATGVATATVIALGAAPLFTALLAAVVQRTVPGARWMAATSAAIAGCAVLILGSRGADVDPVGVLLAAVGSFSYAVYATAAARLIADGRDSRSVMGQLFGGAALVTLPVALVVGAGWIAEPSGALVAAYLAVLVTFLAYRMFGYGLRRTAATLAATVTLVEPAVAAVLGVVVLGERLTPLSWTGMALLAGSLLAVTAPVTAVRRRRRGRRAGRRARGGCATSPSPGGGPASRRPR